MKIGIYYLSFIALILLLVVSCSKKTTKVPETPPAKVEEPEEPTPPTKEPETEVEEEPEPEPKIELSFQTVYFDFDKYNIRSDQRDALAHNAQVLEAYPNVKVLLAGHCDERGTIEYNLALGDKRANAAKDYLITYGIDESRLSTISYGEEQPVDPRSNEQAWAKNRRAEFKIVQR